MSALFPMRGMRAVAPTNSELRNPNPSKPIDSVKIDVYDPALPNPLSVFDVSQLIPLPERTLTKLLFSDRLLGDRKTSGWQIRPWDVVKFVHDESRKEDVEPDVIAYGCLLNSTDAAKQLRRDVRTLHVHAGESGIIPSFKIGRTRLFWRRDVVAEMKRLGFA